MKKVAIIVPHHKNTFSQNEMISLKQLDRVLGDYPIFVVVPERLRGTISLFDWKTIFVNDNSFGTTERYSRTFLSSWLYELFDDYEYMLIYHTDAFVFSDRLMEFCSLGYDYIGAPIKTPVWSSFNVGNGGFSLRKISSTLSVISKKDKIISEYPNPDYIYKYEDIFFGYCGYREDIDFSVPSVDIAQRFAVQDDSLGSYRRIGNDGLPFGVHRWKEEDYGFWKPIIEHYGYKMQEKETVKTIGCLERDRRERLCKHIEGKWDSMSGRDREDLIINMGIEINKDYILWGVGFYGKLLLGLFRRIGINIKYAVDISCKESFVQNDTIVNDIACLKDENKVNVVGAVEGEDNSILEELRRVNLQYGIEFRYLSFFDILNKLSDYMSKFEIIEGVTVPYNICVTW